MGLIITFLAIAIALDPGTIIVNVGEAPAVVYDQTTKSLTVPSYEQTKYIIRCIERDRSSCLRGRK